MVIAAPGSGVDQELCGVGGNAILWRAARCREGNWQWLCVPWVTLMCGCRPSGRVILVWQAGAIG